MTSEPQSVSKIHYSVHGSGKSTVVLLRGLARWSEHWMGFESELSQRGIKVIAIDNRGFGGSESLTPGSSMRIDDLADDVAGVIARESPSGAHVVGVSLGGMIGISLAALKPQFVRSLMIVNSSVSGSNLPRLTAKAKLALLKVIMGAGNSYDSLAAALLGKDTPAEKKRLLAERWRVIDAATKPRLQHVWRQISAARFFDGAMEMASIRCPVTIVKCDGDLFVDPQNSDHIAKQIRGSELVVHPSAGHELAFDDPTWFMDAITKQIVAVP